MAVTFTVNTDDLAFILKQIVVAEREAAGETLQEIIGPNAAILPWGLRHVDGTNNNLLPGGAMLGAADTVLPRLTDPVFGNDRDGDQISFGPGAPVLTNTDYALPRSVVDADPRIISNLIVEQRNTNPAAVAAWHANPLAVAAYQDAHGGALPPAGYLPTDLELSIIPNQSPDIGLSPQFNSWMTFFGQFFDHGLDLITKGGNGTVYIPLQPDDPLYVPGSPTNFMALTRSTPAPGQPTETINTTTSWIDQNQTYTSHASHQVFLREYVFSVDSDGDGFNDSHAVSTGRLLDGADGGIATWGETKAQALTMLGIRLDDYDVLDVPLLRTDAYGQFVPGPNGYAQIATPDGFVEGSAAGLAVPATAIRTGHAFLNDIAHHAEPVLVDHDRNPGTPAIRQVADSDLSGDPLADDNNSLTYDNEMLDSHFVTGDGRGNENIGLTAVHTIFHSEHNRLVAANQATILASGDRAFINEWLLVDIPAGAALPTSAAGLVWDGERLFQAAKFVTEMEYQHLVFEEFARTVQPLVDPFVFTNTPDIDPSIVAEFAHAVYRFGHSMLTNTIDVLDPNMTSSDISLFNAFLNPQAFDAVGGIGGDATDSAGNIIRGMTRQAGNEIDEFVVNDLRNRLVGLPLDLAALNIARGREAGVASFNAVRDQLYQDTGNVDLKPYDNWLGFAQNLKNPLSIVNFIAAYGTHASIVAATTVEGRRAAAMELVLGTDENGDGAVAADRLDFLNATGAYAGGSLGGLNTVDLWIGGLAERKTEFGGMLGSTFNYVFEYQMQQLQNGDRLYYLSRLQGLNLLNELEPNTFAELVMRNTNLGDADSSHLPGHLFQTPDLILEIDQTRQIDTDPIQDTAILQAIDPKVTRIAAGADVNGDGRGDGAYLRFSGGEHVVLGGSEGNDTLIGDRGIDTLWGDGGNDYLNAQTETDEVFGGDGDDIIVDPFGDNFLRGEVGNDVISVGAGFNTLFGGEGQDFITMSVDAGEVFAGRDNDFVLGGTGADGLMGNEGDDWIEGGDGLDSLSGENSQLFFTSTIVGHDVLNGGGNDTDYDGESGDDIMFEGPGIQRNNGMLGFDWGAHKGDPNGANSDLALGIVAAGIVTPPFGQQQDLTLRDRFDSVEALSGWRLDDVLYGSNAPVGAVGAGGAEVVGGTIFDSALTREGVDRIRGLAPLLAGIDDSDVDEFGVVHPGIVLNTSTGANILLGGGGSDLITGRAGDDIIDGDAWLNTRIAIYPDPTRAGTPTMTAEGMTSVVTDLAGNVLFGGKTLNAAMLDRTLNPGQLAIVREILDGEQTGDVDTSVYSDIRANYTLGTDGFGHLIVDHTGFVAVGNTVSDGRDTLNGIDRLRFTDGDVDIFNGTGGADTIVGTPGADIMAGRAGNDTFTVNSAGDVVIEAANGGTDTVRSTLAAYTAAANVENVAIVRPAGAASATGNGLDNVLTGRNGQADLFTGNAGNDILVGGNGAGTDRAVFTATVQNYVFDLAGAAITVTDTVPGRDGSDSLTGIEHATFAGQTFAIVAGTTGSTTSSGANAVNDLVLGFAGTDVLNGNGGNDVLVGGAGNDTVNGGAGSDLILWTTGDGRDLVDGGANADTVQITGDTTAETFRIYTRAAAFAAGITGLAGTTEIVITRNGANTASVIAELDNIEEINVNTLNVSANDGNGVPNGGGSVGDTVLVIGGFNATSLNFSTITIDGNAQDDTVDISSLTSAHRIVFRSNGGHDTIVGTLRSQDVVELAPGLTLADYSQTVGPNGTTTMASADHSITFASSGIPTFRVTTSDGVPGDAGGGDTPPEVEFAFTASDLDGLRNLVRGLPNDGEDDAAATGVRDPEGTGNNVAHPDWSSAAEPFIRLTGAHYGAADANGNLSVNPIFDGLDARAISNMLGTQEADLPTNAKDANIFFMEFGQYFDHGLDFLPKGGNGTIEIGGPGSGRAPGTDNPADLSRGTVSGFDANGIPQHRNMASPLVDQNQAYGSTDLVEQFLRESDGHQGFGARLLAGGVDPSDPSFSLLPTLREAIQHHWNANTIFVADTLPGGSISFRDYYSNYAVSPTQVGNLFDLATGAYDPGVLNALVSNFMGSGFPLLLDTNPFVNVLDHYIAGDGRVNENIALTSMHTIWARNHNFHVDQLETAGFEGSAEETFQAARMVNEAEYQRVVFTEFADMLIGGIRGSGDHGHDKYNPNVDAQISEEFASAVYRVGHSLIGQTLTVIDAAGHERQVPLVDVFLNPTNEPGAFTAPLPPGYVPQPGYEQIGVSAILGGIAGQVAEEVDFNIVDAVRNDLVRINADLFAFNVARGRDVGLGTLNQIRMDLADSQDPYILEAASYAGSLTPYTSWEDFQSRNGLSDVVIAQFRQAYPDLDLQGPALAAFQAANPDLTLVDGHIVKGIDRVDLWVGGLAEAHINGGMVGQTFWVVLQEQFDRLQEGDRFYYLNRFDGFDFYQNFVDGQNFSDIIARNTSLQNLSERIFEATNSDGSVVIGDASGVPGGTTSPGTGGTGGTTLPGTGGTGGTGGNPIPGTGSTGGGVLPDIVPPVAPVLTLLSDTGHSATDHRTSNAALVLATEPGGLLEYRVDGGAFGANYQPDALADGVHTVSVRQTDAAGNVSAPGDISFTLDTHAPIAVADSVDAVRFGQARIGNVLTNDSDLAGSALHVSSIQFRGGHTYAVPATGTLEIEGRHGALTVSADGTYSYSPHDAGEDSFTYTVTDAVGLNAKTSLHFDVAQVAPAASATFAFGFAEAQFDFRHGHALMTAPDGSVADLTGIATLTFSDGVIQQRDGQPLVDDLYYNATNLDVWRAHLDADTHYSQFGWHEGRDPNAVFSTREYLATNQDVAAAGIDPLKHYDQYGWHEGRSPGGAFSADAYLARNADVTASGADPLRHYLEYGQAEGRFAFAGERTDHVIGDFDAAYYLTHNLDVAAAIPAGRDADSFAFQHYLAFGASEGRDPGQLFSTNGYLAANPDVAAAGMNPLLHYEEFGWREGRSVGTGFNSNAYLAANPDVAQANEDPMQHYLTFGMAEGRQWG